jgi:hypothetical protein
MKYDKYVSLKQVYEMSHHTDKESGKNARLVISSHNFCYALHYVYKAYRRTGWLLCRPLRLSTNLFINMHWPTKMFHVVSVTLLIRYGLRFKTAIRIKPSVKLLQSILQTNHYSFQSYTLKTYFPLTQSPINIYHYT